MPLISRDLNDIERRYADMVAQIEVEQSYLSDHEVSMRDFQFVVLSKFQMNDCRTKVASGNYKAAIDDTSGEKVLTPQDHLDAAEARMKQFQKTIMSRKTSLCICNFY
jgi:hypothetical protein